MPRPPQAQVAQLREALLLPQLPLLLRLPGPVHRLRRDEAQPDRLSGHLRLQRLLCQHHDGQQHQAAPRPRGQVAGGEADLLAHCADGGPEVSRRHAKA